MNLLDGRYAPVTDAIGFLEADFSKVVEADQRWRASLGGYVGSPIRGELPALLDALLPLTGPVLRYVWVRTASDWTAYFDNFVNGSDAFPPISVSRSETGVSWRGDRMSSRNEQAGPPQVSFSLYGPEQTDWLNVIRGVSAVEDEGRWEWAAVGTVQRFEEVETYLRRRVRDRLTSEMLLRYSEAASLRPADRSFYGAEGVFG